MTTTLGYSGISLLSRSPFDAESMNGAPLLPLASPDVDHSVHAFNSGDAVGEALFGNNPKFRTSQFSEAQDIIGEMRFSKHELRYVNADSPKINPAEPNLSPIEMPQPRFPVNAEPVGSAVVVDEERVQFPTHSVPAYVHRLVTQWRAKLADRHASETVSVFEVFSFLKAAQAKGAEFEYHPDFYYVRNSAVRFLQLNYHKQVVAALKRGVESGEIAQTTVDLISSKLTAESMLDQINGHFGGSYLPTDYSLGGIASWLGRHILKNETSVFSWIMVGIFIPNITVVPMATYWGSYLSKYLDFFPGVHAPGEVLANGDLAKAPIFELLGYPTLVALFLGSITIMHGVIGTRGSYKGMTFRYAADFLEHVSNKVRVESLKRGAQYFKSMLAAPVEQFVWQTNFTENEARKFFKHKRRSIFWKHGIVGLQQANNNEMHEVYPRIQAFKKWLGQAQLFSPALRKKIHGDRLIYNYEKKTFDVVAFVRFKIADFRVLPQFLRVPFATVIPATEGRVKNYFLDFLALNTSAMVILKTGPILSQAVVNFASTGYWPADVSFLSVLQVIGKSAVTSGVGWSLYSFSNQMITNWHAENTHESLRGTRAANARQIMGLIPTIAVTGVGVNNYDLLTAQIPAQIICGLGLLTVTSIIYPMKKE